MERDTSARFRSHGARNRPSRLRTATPSAPSSLAPGAGHLVALVEEWRLAQGWSGQALVQAIGRHESEWSMFRAAKRRPSAAFVGAVLRQAPEPWKTAFERAYAADLAAWSACRPGGPGASRPSVPASA